MFNARSWLATQIGCAVDELALVESEPAHRIVTGSWPAGAARVRIASEEPIDW